MTDASIPAKRPDPDPKADASATAAAVPAAPEEWKPEPRQWTWKDLFTAPMLAFKPKCMLVSMVTLAAITALMWLYDEKLSGPLHSDSLIIRSVVEWLFYTAALVIFSLGASLVAVFLKADLLDDEFLSFSEALGQYKDRIVPALLVPIFLMGLLAGVEIALVYLPYLLSSIIPYAGPTLYALFYPLLFLFSLFSILLGIAIWLSVFVFPSIVAIRKHGWFDNVVDTIEAVGTKPHVLAASLGLTLVMMFFADRIGFAAIQHLKDQHYLVPEGWHHGVQPTEARAEDVFARDLVKEFNHRMQSHFDPQRLSSTFSSYRLFEPLSPEATVPGADNYQYYHDITGPVTGLWQCLIEAMLLGYVLNLFISGGMLTYLVVREDDYWDDENLEDLDKLAKELEEEAKRDQATAPAAEPPAPGAKAGEPPSATPPA
jgi:hypothetical protein